jgi:putative spermidine/putrescine transport system ATP-binding protein
LNRKASADLELRDLRKTYADFVAVDGVNLRVDHGQFVSLLGPSGCGKTTILRMIAGLIDPDSGRIVLGGDDITRRAVHRRNLGLVFQSYALFPHLTVFENVAFGLRRRSVPHREVQARVERFLDLVRLDQHGQRLPRELSGGQQQRVALARALVTEPGLLLLDEPLSNLDALLRDEMRVELKRLQEELGTTTIFVTHDQEEALTLSDRIAVLHRGRVEQFGTPEEIYTRPATTFVAGFVGKPNILDGTVVAAAPEAAQIRITEGRDLMAPGSSQLAAGMPVKLALRPERLRLCQHPAPVPSNGFPVTVVLRSFAGASVQYVVATAGGAEFQVEVPAGDASAQRGDQVHLAVEASEVIVILPEGAAAPC